MRCPGSGRPPLEARHWTRFLGRQQAGAAHQVRLPGPHARWSRGPACQAAGTAPPAAASSCLHPHPSSPPTPRLRRRRTLDAALLGLPALLLVSGGAAAAPGAPRTAAARSSSSGGEQPGTPPAAEPAPGSAGGRTGGRSTEGSEVPGAHGRCHNVAAWLNRPRHGPGVRRIGQAASSTAPACRPAGAANACQPLAAGACCAAEGMAQREPSEASEVDGGSDSDSGAPPLVLAGPCSVVGSPAARCLHLQLAGARVVAGTPVVALARRLCALPS